MPYWTSNAAPSDPDLMPVSTVSVAFDTSRSPRWVAADTRPGVSGRPFASINRAFGGAVPPAVTEAIFPSVITMVAFSTGFDEVSVHALAWVIAIVSANAIW